MLYSLRKQPGADTVLSCTDSLIVFTIVFFVANQTVNQGHHQITNNPPRIEILLFNLVSSNIGKTTAIRRAAVREISASLGIMWALSRRRPVPDTSRTINALYRIEGFKGPLIGLPLCRETPAYRIADVSFFQSRLVNRENYIF